MVKNNNISRFREIEKDREKGDRGREGEMHIKRRKGKAGEGRKISRKADKEDKALLKP